MIKSINPKTIKKRGLNSPSFMTIIIMINDICYYQYNTYSLICLVNVTVSPPLT